MLKSKKKKTFLKCNLFSLLLLPSQQCRSSQPPQSYSPGWIRCDRPEGRSPQTLLHTDWSCTPEGSKHQQTCQTHTQLSHWLTSEDGTHTGTPCSIRTFGFMMVTSWWRRSGCESKSSGANFFITASSCSAAEAGTPYHVFGSPLKRKDKQYFGLD